MKWTQRFDYANRPVFDSADGWFTIYFSRGFWNCKYLQGKTPGAYYPCRTLDSAFLHAYHYAVSINLPNWSMPNERTQGSPAPF